MSALAAGHEDLTLDADSPLNIPSRPELQDDSSIRVGMELFEGDSGATSQQTNSLIQTRLQAASLALGFGFAIFASWTGFREFFSRDFHLGYGFLALEIFATVVLIGVGVWLSKVPKASSSCLLWCELVIFGVPTFAFTVLHYLEIVFMAPIFDLIPQMPMSGWIILIFVYAIFVPRSWYRILSVVLTISVFPILATVFAMIFHRNVRDLILHDGSSVVEMFISLAATIFAAVSSVRMISNLRKQADLSLIHI